MRKLLLLTGLFCLVIVYLKISDSGNPTEFGSQNFQYDDQFQFWWNNKVKSKQNGAHKADKPDEYLKYYNAVRTKYGDQHPNYDVNYLVNENNKLLNQPQIRSQAVSFDERGPANVPGRTRGIVVDPDDPSGNTWFAGSVGGGIWKTTNAGNSWVNKTSNLPNISISWLVIAPSNSKVLYAGTGEGFSTSAGFIKGAGVFKSINGGDDWFQLEATANDDFQTISRIIVHPDDEKTLLVCANNDPLNAREFNSGIFKSTDGGLSWKRVYTAQRSYVQDLDYEPGNFNVIYAAEKNLGVLKSIDEGESWSLSKTGMDPSGRVEIAVSPVKVDRLFASVEGGKSGNESDLYISDDGAATWNLVIESNRADDINTNVDFLGGQGWYDNIVLAHPFKKDVVYVGGVNLWKFTISDNQTETEPTVLNVASDGAKLFDLVEFGGEFIGGKIGKGNLSPSHFTSIEIKFGPGISQKAHRFVVPPGSGPGVAKEDYSYVNYVEVPFQVWDVDNNRQLMVSFRDQQRDGKYNLITLNTTEGQENQQSREYLYIHNIDYNESPSNQLSVDGGHEVSQLYFLWPYLAESASWEPENLPKSTFRINWGALNGRIRETEDISDAYFQFSGENAFRQTTGATTVSGLHPDHHNLVPLIVDEEERKWKIINANDGGVYVSNVDTNPGENDGDWTNAGNGYNTTQFYFVDKAPGENRYIGGTQDNGTWMTPFSMNSSSTTNYRRALGGDGFGVVWHYTEPTKVLGSVYYNDINKSINSGSSFQSAITGITDNNSSNAPFITKLENSNSQPDVVYAVGRSGIWRTNDFADSWKLINPGDTWRLSTFAQVKISEATPMVVYAGAGMVEGVSNIFVSKDNGLSFEPVNNYADVDMGLISGLATHPKDPSIAFALFSFAKSPKVLKTSDYGQTWADISGFGTSSSSNNGFPDVAVFDLQVMPFDPNVIWVGTEIGIVESTDGGLSWHKLNSNLPSVSVWDIKVEDDQIVMATHGRGIWSVTLSELPTTILAPQLNSVTSSLRMDPIFNLELRNDFDSVGLLINNYDTLYVKEIPSGTTSILVELSGKDNNLDFFLIGYKDGLAYPGKSYQSTLVSWPSSVDQYTNYFSSITNDFNNKEFKQLSSAIFNGKPLQTSHNYKDNTEYIGTLNYPIKVKESDAFISYKDIALVEPYLTQNNLLKDYVVVEASLDGFNWTSLIEPYNASYQNSWLELFEAGDSPSMSDFEEHYIDLLDFFNPGDEILIRFRMTTDSNVNGWGWLIDDLIIQSTNAYLSVDPDLRTDVVIYPTILKNGEEITIKGVEGEISYLLYNTSGQVVQSGLINDSKSVIIKKCFSPGIYILNVYDKKENILWKNKIIIN
ncbi:hypothetical protein [Marinigracilibium pacificum]|uniref:Uncharacterized protein n=1 Tax=Marinigracilibium pacificum TaxID=2729599 RepID=A0A848J0J1_9BACT|nr:hypothetical protein [Marinigracilibium pacificum]NMM49346.1 hypothetical protein [Marinigracilibium pacificum]